MRAESSSAREVVVDGHSLTLEGVEAVARHGCRVALAPAARLDLEGSRRTVDDLIDREQAVYGVTTGFGKFAEVVISRDQAEELQRNLIMSHAAGVGQPFAEEVVRGIMLLRANALASGHSGVRPAVVEFLLEMLNRGVHPVIPQQGSLGASGDLAPLAHMSLVVMGLGEASWNGRLMPGGDALVAAGLHPLTLGAKEGLALINGTQAMTAVACLAWSDAARLARAADVAAALTVEACRGIPAAYDERVHALRPHPGQMKAATNLRALLVGSQLTSAPGEVRVQDPYTLRCIPQVHGAARDSLDYIRRILEIEVNSVTDNPLVFDGGEVISGGNFHGQPVAIAADLLAIAAADLAVMSERRIERLVNPQLSGLPAFLTRYPGLHSGFMLAQYTAASLVSENKVLAHPASVDSIPSSANQEDHVSMGTTAARKAASVVANVSWVLGIELMCAAQAVEMRMEALDLVPGTAASAGAATTAAAFSARLGAGTGPAYEAIRRAIPPWGEDRVLHPDLEAARALVTGPVLLEVVEGAIGPL